MKKIIKKIGKAIGIVIVIMVVISIVSLVLDDDTETRPSTVKEQQDKDIKQGDKVKKFVSEVDADSKEDDNNEEKTSGNQQEEVPFNDETSMITYLKEFGDCINIGELAHSPRNYDGKVILSHDAFGYGTDRDEIKNGELNYTYNTGDTVLLENINNIYNQYGTAATDDDIFYAKEIYVIGTFHAGGQNSYNIIETDIVILSDNQLDIY